MRPWGRYIMHQRVSQTLIEAVSVQAVRSITYSLLLSQAGKEAERQVDQIGPQGPVFDGCFLGHLCSVWQFGDVRGAARVEAVRRTR